MSATLTSPALEKFEALDWPIRTVENWRFGAWKEANLSGLELVGAGAAADLPAEIEGAARFVFQNAELVTGSHDAVTVLSESFGPESRLGSPKLAALHSAKSDHGISITASGEETIEIIHLVTGEGLLLPSLVINAEAGAKLRVIQRFISTDDAAAVVLTAVDVNLGEKADIKYLVTQELNAASKIIRFAESRVAGSANAKQAVIHTGSKWVREETHSSVTGSDGESHILSVALPDTNQEFDQRTFQHHGARETYSNLLFKNTLFGKGKTIFSGLIFVDEGAHGTDAYQTCRNLMMTDDCEAHSMPGLEINADDVKCSHGSTSARVSEEEIFYLMARGIQPKLARSLVAQGFSAEAVEKLEDETLEAIALEIVIAKFNAVD
ncbi:SufD family Fe-S cluster assembly protein [Akkermansiaceae bacterium]|nr:SufD family Fe-S cluster assembly protein [Akkermansiaceae bacterium]